MCEFIVNVLTQKQTMRLTNRICPLRLTVLGYQDTHLIWLSDEASYQL